jgi:hypothetical protein
MSDPPPVRFTPLLVALPALTTPIDSHLVVVAIPRAIVRATIARWTGTRLRAFLNWSARPFIVTLPRRDVVSTVVAVSISVAISCATTWRSVSAIVCLHSRSVPIQSALSLAALHGPG